MPLFYEEWTNETSKLLFKCDDEVQMLCKLLNQFDLSYVKSLKLHYESSTPEAMTRKISSIKGFKGLNSPIIKVENGYIPDLNSRYFTADFPYGLSILVQIADFVGLEARNMKETLNWYYKLVSVKDEYRYTNYGINNFRDFVNFYKQ